MTEILFVLTTIFVAYVIHAIINEQQAVVKAAKSNTVSEAAVASAPAAKAETIAPKTEVDIKPKPALAAKPVAVEPVAKPAVAAAAPRAGVRDPKTGEVTAIANNYRFIKRWIKEALVAEGLLDKVYKNNELDADAEAAIKQALAKFEALEKYRA